MKVVITTSLSVHDQDRMPIPVLSFYPGRDDSTFGNHGTYLLTHPDGAMATMVAMWSPTGISRSYSGILVENAEVVVIEALWLESVSAPSHSSSNLTLDNAVATSQVSGHNTAIKAGPLQAAVDTPPVQATVATSTQAMWSAEMDIVVNPFMSHVTLLLQLRAVFQEAIENV
ncbi:hypothetical protein BC827DRAFT_1151538 [Russula dissimulans]|nr:hypothetical protein BC827DRAFT_1151538 [Russula dissimulans]